MVFFLSCAMEKEHQIFGIGSYHWSNQAGTTIDKVYIQKEAMVN
jgi:23S rRNA (guanosine2251-2'-O)-methyltransferase